MRNKIYVLQKLLPDSKPGDEYIWNNTQKAYYKEGNVLGSYWNKEFVEGNTEWFLPKEEIELKKECQEHIMFLLKHGFLISKSENGRITCYNYVECKDTYEQVLKQPEKPKEEKIVISDLFKGDNYDYSGYWYKFKSTHNLAQKLSEKYEAICKAIENIVNGVILVNADKNYEFTKDDMCDIVSFLRNNPAYNSQHHSSKEIFSDYINNLK